MHLHQAARDREAQTGADALAFDVTGLPILLEDRLVVLTRDARTSVGDGDGHAAIARIDAQHHSAARGELDGIAHHVADDLAHAPAVGIGHRPFADDVDLELFGFSGDARFAHYLLADRVHVDHLAGQPQLAGFERGQIQNVVVQRSQMLAAVAYHREVFLRIGAQRPVNLAQEHVGEAQDRVQGGAQLVAQRRQKVAAISLAYDRDRSDFLAALSHELRTPLNAILGFTDVLLSEVDGPLSADAQENLSVVRNSGQHLRALIDDILDLSALESGELRLTCKMIDVYSIGQEVVREASIAAEAKKLEINIVGKRAMAYADGRRVRQIIGNVVGNAIKFTSRGGVMLRIDPRDGGVTIAIMAMVTPP